MKIDDCSHLYEKGFPLAYFLIPSISKQIMRKLQCKAIYMYTNKWVFIIHSIITMKNHYYIEYHNL